MDEKILKVLSKQDWNLIGRQLYVVAIYWSKRIFGNKWQNLPGGYTIDDIAQDAIRRAFDHDWQDPSDRKILKYLLNSVRSIVSNIARKHHHHETYTFSSLSKTNPEGEISQFEIEEDKSKTVPIDLLLDYEYFILEINKRIDGKLKLRLVFDEIRKGYLPKEISKRNKMDIREVYNLNKRLVRIIDQITSDYGRE